MIKEVVFSSDSGSPGGVYLWSLHLWTNIQFVALTCDQARPHAERFTDEILTSFSVVFRYLISTGSAEFTELSTNINKIIYILNISGGISAKQP